MCRIITVAGKAVKFPYNDGVKLLFSAILSHLLEIRAVIRFPDNALSTI